MRCRTMSCFQALAGSAVVVLGAATTSWATESAAENFARNNKPVESAVSARQRALAQFDTDGDGKLSPTELRAARMALAKKKRQAAQQEEGGSNSPGATTVATGDGSSSSGSGMNPYAIGANGYGNPYLLGSSASGSYYFYGSGAFGQATPGLTGTGGGCMSMGSAGGRR